jgi:prepilin signal peptidase PulO-like enzyme (type II secretory pathway)
MSPITAFHVVCVVWFFVLGAVVGSFLNVCIYRLPWQKSVIWPESRCPKCLEAIAPRDNVPVLSWLLLRGACRHCALPISPRYALVEALVGVLFVGAYVTDVGFGDRTLFAGASFAQLGYHLVLVALLVAATFTDYDYQVIPDSITRTGMVLGLALGAAFPEIRPIPSDAATTWGAFLPGVVGAGLGFLAGGLVRFLARFLRETVFHRDPVAGPSASKPVNEPILAPDETFGLPVIAAVIGWHVAVLPLRPAWGGLVVGVEGLLIGGGLVWFFRTVFSTLLRREAMGFGDITLMAMIGSFLGWQAAVLSFFIAPFFGLAHALWKLVPILWKLITGRSTRAADHEMPFGPYLAMAALVLILTWPKLWPGWAGPLFSTLGALARFLVTGEP